MPRQAESLLHIKNLGPIQDAAIQFGDLTVLVGPQATGKSLILQMLKLCVDGEQIVFTLDKNGFAVGSAALILEQFLGEGMGAAWTDKTAVDWEGRRFHPESLLPKKRREASFFQERVNYIPAQRSLALADGWPQLFHQFQVPPPYVLRQYSQGLNNLLHERSSANAGVLFPRVGRLEASIRDYIDRAIFRKGQLYVSQEGVRRQLKLDYGSAKPSFSSWTAGQREFIPLLLELYWLMPVGGPSNRAADTDWVVLEEPEMGLHPQGILAVMLLVLDLLRRGYRVAMSTHSPLVLDILWALGRLSEWRRQHGQRVKEKDVLALFGGLRVSKSTHAIAQAALTKDYRVYYLGAGDEPYVCARDISRLDPGDDDESMSGWGGLTGVSSHVSSVIGRVAAQLEAEDDA